MSYSRYPPPGGTNNNNRGGPGPQQQQYPPPPPPYNTGPPPSQGGPPQGYLFSNQPPQSHQHPQYSNGNYSVYPHGVPNNNNNNNNNNYQRGQGGIASSLTQSQQQNQLQQSYDGTGTGGGMMKPINNRVDGKEKGTGKKMTKKQAAAAAAAAAQAAMHNNNTNYNNNRDFEEHMIIETKKNKSLASKNKKNTGRGSSKTPPPPPPPPSSSSSMDFLQKYRNPQDSYNAVSDGSHHLQGGGFENDYIQQQQQYDNNNINNNNNNNILEQHNSNNSNKMNQQPGGPFFLPPPVNETEDSYGIIKRTEYMDLYLLKPNDGSKPTLKDLTFIKPKQYQESRIIWHFQRHPISYTFHKLQHADTKKLQALRENQIVRMKKKCFDKYEEFENNRKANMNMGMVMNNGIPVPITAMMNNNNMIPSHMHPMNLISNSKGKGSGRGRPAGTGKLQQARLLKQQLSYTNQQQQHLLGGNNNNKHPYHLHANHDNNKVTGEDDFDDLDDELLREAEKSDDESLSSHTNLTTAATEKQLMSKRNKSDMVKLYNRCEAEELDDLMQPSELELKSRGEVWGAACLNVGSSKKHLELPSFEDACKILGADLFYPPNKRKRQDFGGYDDTNDSDGDIDMDGPAVNGNSSSSAPVDLIDVKNVVVPNDDKWVQCDKCEKWRKLPGYVDIDKLPAKWFCKMNKYRPEQALCSYPEEKYSETTQAVIVDPIENKLKKRMGFWKKRLEKETKYMQKNGTEFLVNRDKGVTDWIQCANPNCGKWRALMKSVEGKPFVKEFYGKYARNDLFSTSGWYCWMNTWDDDKASCTAPEEGWMLADPDIPGMQLIRQKRSEKFEKEKAKRIAEDVAKKVKAQKTSTKKDKAAQKPTGKTIKKANAKVKKNENNINGKYTNNETKTTKSKKRSYGDAVGVEESIPVGKKKGRPIGTGHTQQQNSIGRKNGPGGGKYPMPVPTKAGLPRGMPMSKSINGKGMSTNSMMKRAPQASKMLGGPLMPGLPGPPPSSNSKSKAKDMTPNVQRRGAKSIHLNMKNLGMNGLPGLPPQKKKRLAFALVRMYCSLIV